MRKKDMRNNPFRVLQHAKSQEYPGSTLWDKSSENLLVYLWKAVFQVPIPLPCWLLLLKIQATNLFLPCYHSNRSVSILRHFNVPSCLNIPSFFIYPKEWYPFFVSSLCSVNCLPVHHVSGILQLAFFEGIKVFQNILNLQFLVTSFS